MRQELRAKTSNSIQAQLLQREGLSRFANWMFEQIAPFLSGTIWEAGCGMGTYTQLMLAAGCQQVLATDHDQHLLNVVHRRFAGIKRVRVFDLDLSREEEFKKLRGCAIETIVCLNVLEHLDDDLLVLRNMHSLLPSQGRLVLLVPAHPWLFNGIDEAVHHYRRYTRRELSAKLRQVDFHIRKLYFFNAPAILGWVVYGHLLRRRNVPETSVGLFDRIVPIFRWTERAILRGKLGISLIAVCER